MAKDNAILADAARSVIDRIAALGNEFLRDNPYKTPITKAEKAKEEDLRELAAAIRRRGDFGEEVRTPRPNKPRRRLGS
jgi:hypothetical protein